MDDRIKSKLNILPSNPGVYQFFNKQNQIIYIGKAKNLKKRVSSYFTKYYNDNKLKVLVKSIVDIKFIIVDNEADAFLLENNLIKKYQPRYNIQLKDDKSFPWICVKNEKFPRIFSTRKLIRDGSQYFGPYTSMNTVRIILEISRNLFKYRTCNYSLTEENIENAKFKACLEYHLNNCKAPCINEQSEEEYEEGINQIKKILNGNITSVIDYLKVKMNESSMELNFEEAQNYKEKLKYLENYRNKTTIVNFKLNNLDVFSIINEENVAYVNYIKVIEGSIVSSHAVEIRKRLNESEKVLLAHAICDIRRNTQSTAREIIVPFKMAEISDNVKQTVPKAGDKKKLLEFCTKGAYYFRLEKVRRQSQTEDYDKSEEKLELIRKELGLKKKPLRIECFDNSNLQGSNPVSACIVFENAKPLKSDYRHYNIKTVQGIDDYKSMEEVVLRRYKRILNENGKLPDLVVIDGGKGQLNAALKSLRKLGIEQRVPVIGIAKRLEEIYKPNDAIPLYIDKNSYALRILQHVRNEAHRFGISFHKGKREKDILKSELDNIKGIGKKTQEILFNNFKSIKNIQNSNLDELELVIGKYKAKLVYDFFHD
ncbi:excinuclease ABC subunit UvrC [Bacteroidota bacterium]